MNGYPTNGSLGTAVLPPNPVLWTICSHSDYICSILQSYILLPESSPPRLFEYPLTEVKRSQKKHFCGIQLNCFLNQLVNTKYTNPANRQELLLLGTSHFGTGTQIWTGHAHCMDMLTSFPSLTCQMLRENMNNQKIKDPSVRGLMPLALQLLQVVWV